MHNRWNKETAEGLGLGVSRDATRKVPVPKKYFLDFLRGYFRDNGLFRPNPSFVLFGSRQLLKWIESKVSRYYNLPNGRLRQQSDTWALRYRKKTAIKLMGLTDPEDTAFQRFLCDHGIDLSAHETPEARLEYFDNLVKI